MEKLCVVCGQPMKYINPGVSKTTGKPYAGFWACEDRTHKQPRVGSASFPAPAPQAMARVVKEEPNWDKISFGKCKYGFMLEAYKKGVDPDVAEADAEDWAMRSMRKLGSPDIKNYGNGQQATEIPF